MTDPRLVISDTLLEMLRELVKLQKQRGKKATISSVGADILSEWLPAYIANEQAIARGEGSCVGAMINWGVAPRPQQVTPPAPKPQASIPETEPRKLRGNRDKLQAFLNQ